MQQKRITRSVRSQGLSLTGSVDRGLKTVIEPDLDTHSAHLGCTQHDVLMLYSTVQYTTPTKTASRDSQPVGYDSARFPIRLLLLLLPILQRRIASHGKEEKGPHCAWARPTMPFLCTDKSSAFSPL